MKLFVKMIFLMGILLFSGHRAAAQEELSEGMQTMIDWMTGEFSSSAQAQSDTAYRDLTMHVTRIWPEKPNGVWLYAEKAETGNTDAPFEQVVYFVSELEEDSYTRDVYLLKDEKVAVGAWNDPAQLSKLTPFDLKHQNGCTVFLSYDGFQFAGKTNEKSCENKQNGASYTTTQVIVTEGEVRSWNRGYNEKDIQVWGPENQPYIFKK